MGAKQYFLLIFAAWVSFNVFGQETSLSPLFYPEGCKRNIASSGDTVVVCRLTSQEKEEMLDRIRSNAERLNALVDAYTEPGDYNTPYNDLEREAIREAMKYYFYDPQNATNSINNFAAIYFDQERRKFEELELTNSIDPFLDILNESVVKRTRYRYCQNYDPSSSLVSNRERNIGNDLVYDSGTLRVEAEYYSSSFYLKEIVAFTNRSGYSYKYSFGKCKRIEAKVMLIYDTVLRELRWQLYFIGTYFEDADQDSNCAEMEDFKEGATCNRLDSIPAFQPTDFDRGDLAFIGVKAAQKGRFDDQMVSLMLMTSVAKSSHFFLTNNEWRDNIENFLRNPKVEMKLTFLRDCKYGEELFFYLSSNNDTLYIKNEDGVERAGYYEMFKGDNMSLFPGEDQLFAYEVDTTSSGKVRKPFLVAGLMINKEKPGQDEPNWVPRQLSSTNFLQWVNFANNEVGAIVKCDKLRTADYRSENWDMIRDVNSWKKIPKQLPPDRPVFPIGCDLDNSPTDFVFEKFPTKSYLIPGLVLSEERKRRGKTLKKISRGNVVGTLVVTGLASGVVFKCLSDGKYQDHLNATTFEKKDDYFNDAQKYEKWSYYSFGAAFAIWGLVDACMLWLDNRHERIYNDFFSSSLRNDGLHPTKFHIRLEYNEELAGVGFSLTKTF